MYSTHLPFNYSRSLRLPQHEDIQQTRTVFENHAGENRNKRNSHTLRDRNSPMAEFVHEELNIFRRSLEALAHSP